MVGCAEYCDGRSVMVVLTQRCPQGRGENGRELLVLALTAEERMRSRYRHQLSNGEPAYLQLPRGTCLQHGDVLAAENGDAHIQIVAKPEPVMTVRAKTPVELLKAAYHLGNRHVPLEVTPAWLRLAPDPVLKALLVDQLAVSVVEEIAPFQPEAGAYSTRHEHSHVH